MTDLEFNYELERKVKQADEWWTTLPDVTRVAIWEDLQDINKINEDEVYYPGRKDS